MERGGGGQALEPLFQTPSPPFRAPVVGGGWGGGGS